jgi:predicted DNA-binding protein
VYKERTISSMQRVNYHLPEPVHAKLKALAEKLDMSVAELIRRAVEKYLKEQAKK